MTNRLRVWGLVLVAAALTLSTPRPGAAGIFEPETFTLDNGMQVVVVKNARMPVVHHMVWYRVGAMDEPPGHSGLAHVVEHLMFKGTETAPAGEFSRAVAAVGGRENAFTSADFTGYHQTVAREHLETVMRYEADRMTNLTLDEDQVAREIQVVLEERRQRTDNNPQALLAEHVDAALYLNHPYRRPIVGWAHEISALDREDVLAFYRDWYTPENAILIVSGDITAEELRPLAEKYYGTIPRGEVAERPDFREPPQRAPRRVDLADPRVRQPVFQRTYLAPSHGIGAQDEVDALDVAADLLGSGPTSILYRRLVVEDAIAVAAGAAYNASARGPSSFTVYAAPKPGVDLDTLEAAVDSVLADVLAEGFNATDVDRVKGRLLADSIYARDSLSSGAYSLGRALVIDRSIDDVETWPERLEALNAAEIAAALGNVLDLRRSVTATLTPSGPVEEAAVK